MYFSISNNQGVEAKGPGLLGSEDKGAIPQLILVDSYILVRLLELKRK